VANWVEELLLETVLMPLPMPPPPTPMFVLLNML
jgi:hypothetical protein